jgi:predicted metal-dependent phosphoesterase TrpH
VTADGFRVDMHVKVLDDRVVERAKARGLDALVYAPHFVRLPNVAAKAEAFSDDDLRVFPAREIFTGNWQRRKHVLALGLTDPIPDFLTLEGAMAELDRQDAAVLAPHPEFLTVSLDERDVERFDVDAVEVYNTKHFPRDNDRAVRIARETGTPGFASSYAHLLGTVGEAWTAFEEPVEDVEGLAGLLRDRAPRRVYHREGLRHRLRCAAEFAHLGVENTWGKVDRVLLSATEPTHPGHVAYDGRFDDVRVY